MRRLAAALALHLVPALAFLALPSLAGATGMGLRWNSCRGESNRTFACDRSTGSEVLVGSFEAPSEIMLSGVEISMRISAGDSGLPAWWMVHGAGRCRSSSLSLGFDVSTEAECDDPWQGQAGGGIGVFDTKAPTLAEPATWQSSTPGGYLRMVVAIPQTMVQPISAGRQYAAFRLAINHARTTGGEGACQGCSTPACIWLDHLRLTVATEKNPDGTRPNRDVILTQGLSGMGGASNFVTWQGGTPTCTAGAAKPSTWSDLKKRYK